MVFKILLASILIWNADSQTPFQYRNGYQNNIQFIDPGQSYTSQIYGNEGINFGNQYNARDYTQTRTHISNAGQTSYNNGLSSNQKTFVKPSYDLQPPINKENNRNHVTQKPLRSDSVSNTELSFRFEDDTKTVDANPNGNNTTSPITNFGLNFMKKLNHLQGGGNIVMSPYSISTLLALIQYGALGQTQQEITDALKMLPEISEAMYKILTNDLKKHNSHNVLKIASNVVISDGFNIKPQFKTVAINSFGSEVTPTNFNDPRETVKKMNNWIAIRTNNKIQQLLSPDALSQDTQIVLLNAIYFKGIWETKFKPELTRTKDFYLRNGERKPVPFMHARRILKFDVDPTIKSQILILPFQGLQYSMIIILPSEGVNVDNVLLSLTESQLANYHKFTAKEVQLQIPRFAIKSDIDIGPVLNSMGISKVFGGQSELSNIGTYNGYSPKITSAVHSAVMSIDEQGGSAAAATAFAAIALSFDDPSIPFHANRPFLAVLWDNQLSLPLFMAKIEDPTS